MDSHVAGISTLVLIASRLAKSHDELCGSYYVSVSTHRTSVCVCQHTQNVHGSLCVFVCVRVCPSAHKGCPWLSISTHIITLVLGLSTLTLPVDCSGRLWLSVSTHRTSVAVCVCPCVSVCVRQHTQDVRGCLCVSVSTHRTFVAVRVCPSAHTGRSWLSVSVRVCSSAHTELPWLSISTHISTLVLGLSTLALPVDCSSDFGPHGLSVQYTERLWVSVRTHMTSVCVRQHTKDVSGCPCVSVSTHRTSVAVCVCPSAHTGRSWLSVCVNQHTQDVRGCPCVFVTLTLPVDCSGDFGPRGLSVQYTQDVCGCPSAHTDVRGCPPAHIGRLWLSVCVRVYPCTHRTSVAVHQYTYQHAGPWIQHAGPSLHTGHPWVSASTHRTSVAIRVCPSAHTRHPWLSISTNISMLVLGLSTLTLTVDCSSDFGPRGLSVQFTHDVRGCPSAHTRRLWLSVCVRVWPCVSVSTHRMSVAVHQYTYQHAGRLWVSVSTHKTSVCVCQHTQDVHGCPCVTVCVRQHTQDVRGCPSVHISARWSLDSAR
ncbi:hypothetical protein IGI04_042549 [Brassica rapa subsp. trilocularis]|uniref:Uncharacterized protein n=1 Tax=Brassica rapa subsp. trilocularis TaxID=1813537 RepID=A0ABQ7KJ44_BRACM|nr:hypothetical protein IGI04_042549 [Brassica rapa subsp. trilocularis]